MATAFGVEESAAATSIQDIPLIKPSREIPTTFKSRQFDISAIIFVHNGNLSTYP
jgi:hypothetical protein